MSRFFLFLCLLLVAACSSNSSNDKGGDTPNGETPSTTTFKIGDKTPSEYYDQFIFESSDKRYRKMSTTETFLDVNADGSRRAQLQMKLSKTRLSLDLSFQEEHLA